MKKHNLIITGALGHIGSYFIHNSKFNNFKKIILIDNLSTQRYCSLFNLKNNRIEFIDFDIVNYSIEKYFNRYDTVIHLAAITDAQSSINKYKEVEKNNYLGTKNVIKICIKKKCKLIFPSTTSVYGSQDNLVDENCPKSDLKPQSPYAFFKLKSEEMLLRYSKNTDLKFIIIRLGTIFGISKGMRFHTAINKFCWQASNNMPVTVWKTAYNQKRPYLDIKDSLKFIEFVLKKNMFDSQIYNLLTINSNVKTIVEIIKKYKPRLKVKFVNSKIMNQLSYEVSVEKIKHKGFKVKGSLDESIQETLELLK